jgi:hypothetical protein
MALAAAGLRPEAKSKLTVDQMRKIQRLLELKGPFEVSIPFAEALIIAGHSVPAFVRARRDTGQVLAAVRASAILHAYQRKLVEGTTQTLIATIDDYRHAYTACASGMTAVYNPQASAEVIAFVKVLEKLRDERKAEAQKARDAWLAANAAKIKNQQVWEGNAPEVPDNLVATYEQIRAALGVPSTNTVADRVKKAIAAGVLERKEAQDKTGGRHRSEWLIKVPSSEMLTEATKVIALPTPESVKELFTNPTAMEEARALFEAQEVQQVDQVDPPAAANPAPAAPAPVRPADAAHLHSPATYPPAPQNEDLLDVQEMVRQHIQKTLKGNFPQ